MFTKIVQILIKSTGRLEKYWKPIGLLSLIYMKFSINMKVKIGSLRLSILDVCVIFSLSLYKLLWNHFYSWGTNFRGFRG
jgi:hypothetical protein